MPELDRFPFHAYEERFLTLVHANSVVILSAETGAGKSTLCPLALLRAGFARNRRIVVTEPRRPAATNLAKRVAYLHGTKLGDVIGYHIAKDRQTSRSTKLVYKTEGVLLGEIHSDALLSRYSVIILDEVHERGINQDLLMLLVKQLCTSRPDLKVIIMSATIDTQKFSQYFGGAPVLEIPGRIFPVEIRYAQETPSDLAGMIDAAIKKVCEILRSNESGDILVFMPDEYSITKVVAGIAEQQSSSDTSLRILPLFGAQDPEVQAQVYIRDHRRRVIVSTNIAETSLTIDGVRHVVDSGLIKTMVKVDTSMSLLRVVGHSRAGCNQRKGRAGRTQEGFCHRLFSQQNFLDRDNFSLPEILRMSLDQVLLRMKCYGYDVDAFDPDIDFLDKPNVEQWMTAISHLELFGAISNEGTVTEDGLKMNRFPLDLTISRMILEGAKRKCLSKTLIIAACLMATHSIFLRPKGCEDEADACKKKFQSEKSDLLTMLHAWEGWQNSDRNRNWAIENFLSFRTLAEIDLIRLDLLELMRKEGIAVTSVKNDLGLRKALATGLLTKFARLGEEREYVWNDKHALIFPGSSVASRFSPEYLVFTKVTESQNRRGPVLYMHNAHVIEAKWLFELIPLDACSVQFGIATMNQTNQRYSATRYFWNDIEIATKYYDKAIREFVVVDDCGIERSDVDSLDEELFEGNYPDEDFLLGEDENAEFDDGFEDEDDESEDEELESDDDEVDDEDEDEDLDEDEELEDDESEPDNDNEDEDEEEECEEEEDEEQEELVEDVLLLVKPVSVVEDRNDKTRHNPEEGLFGHSTVSENHDDEVDPISADLSEKDNSSSWNSKPEESNEDVVAIDTGNDSTNTDVQEQKPRIRPETKGYVQDNAGTILYRATTTHDEYGGSVCVLQDYVPSLLGGSDDVTTIRGIIVTDPQGNQCSLDSAGTPTPVGNDGRGSK